MSKVQPHYRLVQKWHSCIRRTCVTKSSSPNLEKPNLTCHQVCCSHPETSSSEITIQRALGSFSLFKRLRAASKELFIQLQESSYVARHPFALSENPEAVSRPYFFFHWPQACNSLFNLMAIHSHFRNASAISAPCFFGFVCTWRAHMLSDSEGKWNQRDKQDGVEFVLPF